MDPLPLDPGPYDGTYKAVGGQPSLDLVNTVSWPGEQREHDWFDRPANVVAWVEGLGVFGSAAVAPLRRRLDLAPDQFGDELHDVRSARADLRAVLVPLAHHQSPPVRAVEGLSRLLRHARQRQVIDPRTLQWSWRQPAGLMEAIAPAIDNAGHVLTATDHSRLGHCPACGWLFYDTSRNRSRRWCDMADCGSRDKALRYYHRTHNPG